MKISIGVPPVPDSVDLALRAEALGYDRLWLYDSPALYEDIWIHLGRLADATSTLGLGAGVLVPSLRHVMVTASAIASIERLAPGRLAIGFGTGYTARLTMGQPALPWRFVREYVEQLRGLLRGDVVEVEGEPCQMLHHADLAVPRPISVPLLLSAFGPKGREITREIGDGWVGFSPPPEPFEWSVEMVNGTVLASGEPPTSPRVLDAAGPWQVGAYHFLWETAAEALDGMPGGSVWRARIEEERPEGERHLAAHYGHVTHLSTADRLALDTFGGEVPWHGWVDDAAGILQRAEASAAAGVTELVYTPAGPDLPGQAEAFLEAARPVQG